MRAQFTDLVFQPLPGALQAALVRVTPAQLMALCRWVRDHTGRLVTLWGEDRRSDDNDFALCVALECGGEVIVAELPLREEAPIYRDLSEIFPTAARLQRATTDLMGFEVVGGDERPWLRHSAWSPDVFPLRNDAVPVLASPARAPSAYPFVRVEGDGVHEIPVGPVHAGTIEPGHFRFSVVGEKVLRLEARLGYVHKGIEKRFEGMALADGARLAARVSGDSAVAYAWSYAMAAEAITRTQPPPRALVLRGVLLERERIANHLGDLGALGNDAGFAVGLAQFSRLKEDLLRVNAQVWGQRYPMDAIVPGGVRDDVSADALRMLDETLKAIAQEVVELRNIYDNHAGVQDRFAGAGRVSTELARNMGIVGLAARASGLALDWRHDIPVAPYGSKDHAAVVRDTGDVAARVAIRFEETIASIDLCRSWLTTLPAGSVIADLGPPTRSLGIGGVEGWRGPVFVALHLGSDGRVLRCHPHDPSWHNWPVLEHAIIDNIVPDFPLINKSFNLSYSGPDL